MRKINTKWLDMLRDIVRRHYHFVSAPIRVSTLATLLRLIDDLMEENQALRTNRYNERFIDKPKDENV